MHRASRPQAFQITRIRPGCVWVKVHGVLTEDDCLPVDPEALRRSAGGHADVLLDLTEFSGCNVHGLARRFRMQAPAGLAASRIAIVCHSETQRWVVEATAPWFSDPICLFAADQLSAAVSWLGHAHPDPGTLTGQIESVR